jgi:hypothetical protein
MRAVMPTRKIAAIKHWIENMGFELVNSHFLNSKFTRINYYSLGNFGVYEEISEPKKIYLVESLGRRL